MSSARTLQKGKFQVSMAPGAYGAVSSTSNVYLPQLDLQGRYGVTDRFELGARLWLVGAAVDAKFGLFRSADPNNGFNLSVDPGLGYLGLTSSGSGSSASVGTVTLYLPVLLGFRFAGHELTVGPKLVDMVLLGSSNGTSTLGGNILLAGSSIGFAIRVGDNFKITPEASFLYPFAGSTTSGSNVAVGGGAIVQLALGFQFGGAETPPPATDLVGEEAPSPPPTTL